MPANSVTIVPLEDDAELEVETVADAVDEDAHDADTEDDDAPPRPDVLDTLALTETLALAKEPPTLELDVTVLAPPIPLDDVCDAVVVVPDTELEPTEVEAFPPLPASVYFPKS